MSPKFLLFIIVSSWIIYCRADVFVDSEAVCPCKGTKSRPYKTIQDGLDVIAFDGNHTVIVNPGIYTGTQNTNLTIGLIDYSQGLKQTIMSSSSSIDTIIDCNNMTISEYDFIFNITASNVILSGFTIQNCLKDRVIYASSNATVETLNDITLNDIKLINNTADKISVIYIQYFNNVILNDIELVNNTDTYTLCGRTGDNIVFPGFMYLGNIGNGTNGVIGSNITILNNIGKCMAGFLNLKHVETSYLNYLTIENNIISDVSGNNLLSQSTLNYDESCNYLPTNKNILNNSLIRFNYFTSYIEMPYITGGIASSCNLEIYNTLIASNNGTQGTGLLLDAGVSKIYNATVINNTAFYGGGGIYSIGVYPSENNPNLFIYNSTIKDNIALGKDSYGYGNEIECVESWISIINTDISTNLSNKDIVCPSSPFGCLIVKYDGSQASVVCNETINN